MQQAKPVELTLIINGRYGLPSRLQQEISSLESSAVNITRLTTTPQNTAQKLARRAIEDGHRLLVACGGDGTLNEVVNGVMELGPQHRSKVVLAVLPLGSANDFSRMVGRHPDLKSILEHYQRGAFRKIDLGRLTFQSPEQQRQQRYFINICDVGIGGYVAESVNRKEKWLGAAMAYQASIIQALFKYRNTPISIHSDQGEWQGRALNIVLANSRYFAHGLCIAPEAELSDGKIQMVRLGKVSLFDYLRNLGRLKRCQPIHHPDAVYQKITHCRVDSRDRPVPVETDGEFVGYTPVEMSLLPAELNFIILQDQKKGL